MRLARARVQNYRSIKDSGWFAVEARKSILVGPNEAGKTAVLRALEHVSPGPLVTPFDPLRDYPRSEYWRLQSGEVDPGTVPVVSAEFELSEADRAEVVAISPAFANIGFFREVSLNNVGESWLVNAPPAATVGEYKSAFRSLEAIVETRFSPLLLGKSDEPGPTPSQQLRHLLADRPDSTALDGDFGAALRDWLDTVVAPLTHQSEEERVTELRRVLSIEDARIAVLDLLQTRRPTLVYFSVYTRVRPVLHLQHLADAIDAGALEDSDTYNFGNRCLLDLLGFSARELSDLGKSSDPAAGDDAGFQLYRSRLDQREAMLNSASFRLTKQIRQVWDPYDDDPTDYTLRISADQQYLKLSVVDALGADIELDQRSEGFQWLVSFFVVFFAQTKGDLRDAILLLDEPGMSLHGLKQRAFCSTLDALAEKNQLLFTTHSPFLVGPDELHAVRIVEMANRDEGTKVRDDAVAADPGSLLPLQEALGYDLAQSLFAHERNLVVESLSDYWYLESVAVLLREAGGADLNDRIALLPGGTAAKAVYFATILHAHNLKVAALLDSDATGEAAVQQDVLVQKLGHRSIVRTKDAYAGPVPTPRIEDLMRETLVHVARDDLGWDVDQQARARPDRSIIEIFETDMGAEFSEDKLAKAFIRWTRDHSASEMSAQEQIQLSTLIRLINESLQ